jgi:hypothetical protein
MYLYNIVISFFVTLDNATYFKFLMHSFPFVDCVRLFSSYLEHCAR